MLVPTTPPTFSYSNTDLSHLDTLQESRDSYTAMGKNDPLMYKALSLPRSLYDPLLAMGLTQDSRTPRDWVGHAWLLATSSLSWSDQKAQLDGLPDL